MKKVIFILITFLTISTSAFAERIYNFFGYNTWEHTEIHEDGTKETTVRSVFNNGTYFVGQFPAFSEDEFGFAINDHTIYIDSTVEIYEEDGHVTIRTQDPPISSEDYIFELDQNSPSLKIESFGEEYKVSKLRRTELKGSILYTYSVYRPKRDERGRDTVDYETVVCQDFFCNESTDLLNRGIAFAIYSLNEGYGLYNEVISQVQFMHLPELRIMKNAIYAVHGYSFKSYDLKELFSSFSWYKPVTSQESDIILPENEQMLLDAILKRTQELQFDEY